MWRFILKVIIACLISGAFSLTTGRPTMAQTLDQCTSLDAVGMREHLNSLIGENIGDRFKTIDVDALVKASWERQKVSENLDALADRIVGDLRKQKSYWERLWSNYSPETATAYATEVTDRYFHSKEFTDIINSAVKSAGDELAKQLDTHLAAAGDFAIRCFNEFLKGSYSGVIRSGIETYVTDGVKVKLAPHEAIPNIDDRTGNIGTVVLWGAIAAALSRRAVQRILTSIIDRLVKRIVGKIVASIAVKIGAAMTGVGSVVAAFMLAWEILSGADGVFPQIREELAGQKTKDELRMVIISEFNDILSGQVSEISRDLSGAIAASWDQFKSRYRALLDTSEKVPEFKAWLARQPEGSFNAVARTVDVIVKYRHEKGLVEAVQSGLLDRVGVFPEEAFIIIEGSQSFDQAVVWVDKFPDRLKQIVAFEIYRYVDPSAISRDVLLRILAADDKIVARKLLTISAASRDAILLLPDPLVMDLAVRLDVPLLEDMGAYWPLLDTEQRLMLARAVIRVPSVAGTFARPSVRSIIADAPNRREAISFFSQTGGFLPLSQVASEVVDVAEGSVSINWFYAKYERGFWPVIAILAFIMLAPALLRRLLGLGRTRVIVRNGAGGASK
jgi:hypothetical protein